MTPTDLRMRFKTETGLRAIDQVNSKNRHAWLSDHYAEWLEGNNLKLREQFKKETGLTAIRSDRWGNIPQYTEDQIYRDLYKMWLEERRLEVYNVLEKLKR